MDRNEPVRLSAALGVGDLDFTAQTFGGGGNGAGAAVTLADAAISAGYAELRRRVPRRWPRASSAATARPAGRAGAGARAFTAPYGMLTPAQTTAMQTMRFMHDHGVTQDSLAEVALASLRPRPAQPAGDPLRHAADARGVPRVALDRRAVPPLRLLPGERRRGGDRRDDRRAGPRPAPGRRWRSSPRAHGLEHRDGVARVRRGQLPDRPPPPRRAAAVAAGRRHARPTSRSPSSTRTSPARC